MDLDTALTGQSRPNADAVQMVRDDHAELRRLIDEYRAAAPDQHARRVVLEALMMQIELHTRIEEDVFYPVLRDEAGAEIERALAAHRSAAQRIAALGQSDDGTSDDDAESLIEGLVQHMDEEERTLLPAVERRPAGELQALGAEMMKRRETLTRSVEDMEGPAT